MPATLALSLRSRAIDDARRIVTDPNIAQGAPESLRRPSNRLPDGSAT